MAISHLGGQQRGELPVREVLVLVERLDVRDGGGYLEPEVVHRAIQLLQGVELERVVFLLQKSQHAGRTGRPGWRLRPEDRRGGHRRAS